MKSTPVIFFFILLSGSVHASIKTHEEFLKHAFSNNFDEFLQRLEKSVENSAYDDLQFNMKNNLVADLKETSNKFKELCLQIDHELIEEIGESLPVKALGKAVNRIFNFYKAKARYDRDVIKEIQAQDPLGFNIFLNMKNEDETSPNFMEYVEDFRKLMYTTMPIGADSKYRMIDFYEFLQRLEENMKETDLRFTLQSHLFKDLKETSAKFKDRCIRYELEVKKRTGHFSPVSSLERSINKIFHQYKECAKENRNIVKDIQSVDPIGFHVFLTKKNESECSPAFIQSIKDFQATMYDRVRLFYSKSDNSHIELYSKNSKKKLYDIPENVRERVTTEYRAFDNFTINFFTELAMEQFFGIKMYRLYDRIDMKTFKQHISNEIDDVQILYSPKMPTNPGAHAVCAYYQASSQNVLIYDSSMFETLDTKQFKILDRLYPFKKEIIYVEPKTRQKNSYACGIFSLIYANMLLLGSDPAKEEIRLNKVYGDDTLYMRLHILNMFANRQLTLMK